MAVDLLLGDCLDVLPTLADASVDSIVTDPPYELGFMGKGWDGAGIANSVPMWAHCLRVLKPGGHLLAFSGSRTYHRMVCAIEDAGFEVRDQIMWLYGSGFPKSYDVAKGVEGTLTMGSASWNKWRDLNGEDQVRPNWGSGTNTVGGLVKQQAEQGHRPKDYGSRPTKKLDATTPEAVQWQGWGTALKPAHEPIVLARKPLEGTVAANVLKHGTGALNIDGCRVDAADADLTAVQRQSDNSTFQGKGAGHVQPTYNALGRWPANIIHDGSDEVVSAFPETSSPATYQRATAGDDAFKGGVYGTNKPRPATQMGHGDSGSAARFFYCAKASKKDRGENTHPTVKPTDLMRYLCRLVTPPGGTVLDPFMGSGSTGRGAALEGFSFIGIEREAEYHAIAERRIDDVASNVPLLLFTVTPVPRVATGG